MGRFRVDAKMKLAFIILIVIPTTYSFVVNCAPKYRSCRTNHGPNSDVDGFKKSAFTCMRKSKPTSVPMQCTEGDSSNPELVEISVEELASLLQAAGVQQVTPDSSTADSSLSSFLSTPQAKEMMEAMAKQVAGGSVGSMSAAAALPFVGKGDPGKPLRKSAADGDVDGIQNALDAAVWVRKTRAGACVSRRLRSN